MLEREHTHHWCTYVVQLAFGQKHFVPLFLSGGPALALPVSIPAMHPQGSRHLVISSLANALKLHSYRWFHCTLGWVASRTCGRIGSIYSSGRSPFARALLAPLVRVWGHLESPVTKQDPRVLVYLNDNLDLVRGSLLLV